MAWRTSEERQRLLSEFRSSKESKTQFCKRNKIGATTFYRWQIRAQQTKSEPIRLLPVVSAVEAQQDFLELILPKGAFTIKPGEDGAISVTSSIADEKASKQAFKEAIDNIRSYYERRYWSTPKTSQA